MFDLDVAVADTAIPADSVNFTPHFNLPRFRRLCLCNGGRGVEHLLKLLTRIGGAISRIMGFFSTGMKSPVDAPCFYPGVVNFTLLSRKRRPCAQQKAPGGGGGCAIRLG